MHDLDTKCTYKKPLKHKVEWNKSKGYIFQGLFQDQGDDFFATHCDYADVAGVCDEFGLSNDIATHWPWKEKAFWYSWR